MAPITFSDWPGKFAPIPWVYGEIVRALAPGEIGLYPRELAGTSAAARRDARARGGSADLARVEFYRLPRIAAGLAISALFVRRAAPRPEVGSYVSSSTAGK